MQPTTEGLMLADRGGFAREHQKGGLKYLLSILQTVEHPAGHVQDHLAVPPHQGSKSNFVPLGREALQQLPVRQTAGALPGYQLAEMTENAFESCLGHAFILVRIRPSLYLIVPRTNQ